ncbi:hypothetical protein EBB07_29600 [Paenibacillaceae bacterium]|nr:hypothetical protein EBB07_29600 [Paenibacillaceae bacterium]
MKRKLPMFVAGTLFGLAISVGSIAVAANAELVAKVFNRKIVVDGKELKLEDKPLIINNKTYLPVRNIAEGLGYNVTLNEKQIELKTKTVVNNTTTNNDQSKVSNDKGEYVKDLNNIIKHEDKLDVNRIKSAIAANEFSINVQDKETGYSLMHYVVLENDFTLYSYLKANKANFELQDNEGRTPLHISVIEKNNLYFGELTNEFRVKTKTKDNYGKTASDYAEQNSTFFRALKNYKE